MCTVAFYFRELSQTQEWRDAVALEQALLESEGKREHKELRRRYAQALSEILNRVNHIQGSTESDIQGAWTDILEDLRSDYSNWSQLQYNIRFAGLRAVAEHEEGVATACDSVRSFRYTRAPPAPPLAIQPTPYRSSPSIPSRPPTPSLLEPALLQPQQPWQSQQFRQSRQSSSETVPCQVGQAELQAYQRLVHSLKWDGEDYASVSKLLRMLGILPRSFTLRDARFAKAQYRPETLGVRGKRGKRALPSYTYQLLQQGCSNWSEVLRAIQEIQNHRFLVEDGKWATHSHMSPDARSRLTPLAGESCVAQSGNDILDFLRLVRLGNLTAADVRAIVNVLALEDQTQKVLGHQYRVGDFYKNLPQQVLVDKERGRHAQAEHARKTSFLKRLLQGNCNHLQVINRFIYHHILDQTQQEAFLQTQ
jgi:hypothetical protein